MAQLDEGKQYWTLLDLNSKGCRQRIRPSGGASSRAAYIILAVLRLARISLTSIRGFDKWRPWFATSTSHARRVDEINAWGSAGITQLSLRVNLRSFATNVVITTRQ